MTRLATTTTLLLGAAALILAPVPSQAQVLRGLQVAPDKPGGKGGSGSGGGGGGGGGGGSQFAAEMLKAVNAERQKQGLSPYCTNAKLQKAAQAHSEDQAKTKKMSHTGSNGSDMSQRIKAAGFQAQGAGENVAAGQKDVADVMKSWMNSDGHRANILGKYKFFGMGYATNGGGPYWTQNFGSSSSESCSDGGDDKPSDGDTTPTPAPDDKPDDKPQPKPTPAPMPDDNPGDDNNKPMPTRPMPTRPNKPDDMSPMPTRPNKPDGMSPMPTRPNKPDGMSPMPTRPSRPDNGGGGGMPTWKPNRPDNGGGGGGGGNWDNGGMRPNNGGGGGGMRPMPNNGGGGGMKPMPNNGGGGNVAPDADMGGKGHWGGPKQRSFDFNALSSTDDHA